ncbi:MAG: hypothetical protein IVW57_09985 [Ktedonobacterales bacterium]|nr:hypothetical protein [Ktedonobacterales bacterium]
MRSNDLTRPLTRPWRASRWGTMWMGAWPRLALGGARARWGWMATPLALALVVRVALLVSVAVAVRHVTPARFSDPLTLWLYKDAVWYLRIAEHGYFYSATSQSSVNFFPLYPLLIHLFQPVVALVVRGGTSYLVAGMLVAWLAFCAACVVLYRLALDRFGPRAAVGAVLLLVVYPFGYYFGSAFSESLYLLLGLLAFLGIERRNWWLAGSAALLAGAARPPGLVVAACVTLAYALDWLRARHAPRRDVLALGLGPLGTVAYGVYCWVRFGNPFAYLRTSEAGWQRGKPQLGGFQMAGQLLTHPGDWLGSQRADTRAYGVYAILLVVVLVCLIPIARQLGPAYALFTLVGVLAPIATVSSIESLGRYISVLFPVFLIWGSLLRRWPLVLSIVVTVSAMLLVLFATSFAAGAGLA